MALNLESATWLQEMARRRMVLHVLLTLLIHGTADDFLASCRLAAIRSPAYTVNAGDITGGVCGGFIGAGLLFQIISPYNRERRKEWRGK